jgi:hypothetical protein
VAPPAGTCVGVRAGLHRRVLRGESWWTLWLLPERLPTLDPEITLMRHGAPPAGA